MNQCNYTEKVITKKTGKLANDALDPVGVGLTVGKGVSKISNSIPRTVYRTFGQDSRAQGLSWTPKNPSSVSVGGLYGWLKMVV